MNDYPGGHARDRIRSALTMLLSDKTAASNRVYNNRRQFLNGGVFPRIRVSTPLERVSKVLSDTPLILRRELTLKIEIKTRSSIASEKELDQISRAIESLLNEDETLDNGCTLTFDTATPESSSIGRHCFDSLVLEYRCEYDTASPEPNNIDDFKTAHADFNIDDDADSEAEDTLSLPQ